MREIEWLKDLVRSELKMEENGIVDVETGYNPQQSLDKESVQFLNQIKEQFIDYATVFNKLRGAAIGGVKIYGISKTQADFMLFRNGFKLFFLMERPGSIKVRTQFHTANYAPGSPATEQQLDQLRSDDIIEARWGAFGEVIWTHRELPVNTESLVKYHFTRFVKESAK